MNIPALPMALIAAALALLAASPAPARTSEGKAEVLASFLPLWAFASEVAGRQAHVHVLIPPGSGVHDFTMRPTDMAKIARADLLVLSGLGLEAGLGQALSSARRVVIAGEGIEPIRSAEAGHGHAGVDPHVWLDPLLAAHQVERIRDGLMAADPAHAEEYRANADAYSAALRALDAEIAAKLAGLKGAVLITYHESFAYFARRYGLEAHSLAGMEEQQPTPGRVRALHDLVRTRGVRAVFAEAQYPRESFRRFAASLGLQVCTMDTLSSGPLDPEYYIAGMRANAAEIARCLGGAR